MLHAPQALRPQENLKKNLAAQLIVCYNAVCMDEIVRKAVVFCNPESLRHIAAGAVDGHPDALVRVGILMERRPQ